MRISKPYGEYDVIAGICHGCFHPKGMRAAVLNCELIKARAEIRATAVARGVTI